MARIKASRIAVRMQPINIKSDYTYCLLGNQESIILGKVTPNERVILIETKNNHNYMQMHMDMMMGKTPKMKVEQETPLRFSVLPETKLNMHKYYYVYDLV